MRTLVFSDSHGDPRTMSRMLKRFGPDMVLYCGDGVDDFLESVKTCPHAKYDYIIGNCDQPHQGDKEKLVSLDGVKVFITHGDRYDSTHDLVAMTSVARKAGAQVFAYGHTHVPSLSVSEGIVILNPGSICSDFEHNTFAMIDSFEQEYQCSILFADHYVTE